MALYRQLHTSFWQDGFVLSLTPEEKYFYIYLLTNSKTKQCGIYELPFRIAEIETGYNQESVEKLIKRFCDFDKIKYDRSTSEIAIKNWMKYNPDSNPKIRVCVEKELKATKNRLLIPYVYPMYRVSQEEYKNKIRIREEEEEQEAVPAKMVFTPPTKEEVINFFKDKGDSEKNAVKAFEYYQEANWHDSKGKAVKNWKQKMIANWLNKNEYASNKNRPARNDYAGYAASYDLPEGSTSGFFAPRAETV